MADRYTRTEVEILVANARAEGAAAARSIAIKALRTEADLYPANGAVAPVLEQMADRIAKLTDDLW